MNTLYKSCGKKVEVNDRSLEYALSLGWTEKDPTKKETAAQKKKREEAESEAELLAELEAEDKDKDEES